MGVFWCVAYHICYSPPVIPASLCEESNMVGIAGAVIIDAMLLFLVSGNAYGQTDSGGNPIVRDALLQASSRLARPKCSSIFSAGAMTALLSAKYSLISLGKPRVGPDGRFGVLSAMTLKADKQIVI